MEDERKIEGLKIKIINKLPNKYKKLKQVIATRSFSEKELEKLLKSATALRELFLYKLKEEKIIKQKMLNIYPVQT